MLPSLLLSSAAIAVAVVLMIGMVVGSIGCGVCQWCYGCCCRCRHQAKMVWSAWPSSISDPLALSMREFLRFGMERIQDSRKWLKDLMFAIEKVGPFQSDWIWSGTPCPVKYSCPEGPSLCSNRRDSCHCPAKPENALPLSTGSERKDAIRTSVEAEAPVHTIFPIVTGPLDQHTISFLESYRHTSCQVPLTWLTQIIVTVSTAESCATATTKVATIWLLFLRLHLMSLTTSGRKKLCWAAAQGFAPSLEFHPPPDQLHHPWRPPECSALLRHRCHPTPVAPACSFGQGDNITSHKLQSQPCCSLGKTGKNWISNIWSILMAFNDFPPTISSGSSRGSLWPSTSAPKPSMPLTDVRDTVQLLSWLRRSQPEPPASKLAGLRNALNFSWGIFHCVWRHQRDPEGTKSIQKLYNFGGAEITSDPCWNDESYISVILARILSLPLPPQNHPCPNLSKCLVAFPHFPRFATLIQWRLELAHAKPRIAGVFQLTIELMTVSPQGKHRDCCKIYF